MERDRSGPINYYKLPILNFRNYNLVAVGFARIVISSP